ncbi:MAG: 50S ribosomal protein L9 [Saprospiraceae bacterium]|nr:50S ribosomal protein L9 [Saprospiraceae bacterium]
MEIILLNDIDKVGDKYDVIKVKAGFGRNYLIPKGLALVASETNLRRLANLKRQEDILENKKLSTYRELAAQLEGVTLRIGAKTGTSGKIFGSVTNVQIAQALKDQINLEVQRKKIKILDDIKELGLYSAQVDFHKEVIGKVNFEVVAE